MTNTESLSELRLYCDQVPGPKMANMVEQGDTLRLSPGELQDIGYTIPLFSLILILVAIRGMEDALERLITDTHARPLADFVHLRDVVGFPEYYDAEERYAAR